MKIIQKLVLMTALFVVSTSTWAGNIADPNDPNYDADADPCFGLRGDVTRANNAVEELLAGIGRELDNIQRSQDAQTAALQQSAQSAWDAAQAAFDGATSAATGDTRGFGQAVGDLTVAIGNFLPGVSGVDLSAFAKKRLQQLSDQLGPANQAAANAKAALDECVDKYEVADTGNGDGGDFLIGGEDGTGNTGGAGSGSGSGGSGSGKGNGSDQIADPDWARVNDFTKVEVEQAIRWINRELSICQQFPANQIRGCVNATVSNAGRLRNKISSGISNASNATDRLSWIHIQQSLETARENANQMKKR